MVPAALDFTEACACEVHGPCGVVVLPTTTKAWVTLAVPLLIACAMQVAAWWPA